MATTKTTRTKAAGDGIASIKEAMLKKLAGSALSDKDATLLRFQPHTAEQAGALGLPSATEGFLIPYFDIAGKPTKFIRFRYTKETRKGFEVYGKKKALRYGQVPGTVNEVYMPPLVKWQGIIDKPEMPIIITEGELKAACATKHGLPTIGLGGVWCFMSKRAGVSLLPVFDQLKLAGRVVYICYDSDAVTNPDVVAAELRLAAMLTTLGAIVMIARIPAEGDAKMGVDDYIVAHGAKQFKEEVLDNAFEYETCAALHAMNERVAYVRVPGCVYSFEYAQEITPQAFTGHAYSNLTHDETEYDKDGNAKIKRVPTAAAWLKWQYRSELRGITFRPGFDRVTPDGYLNTWNGWGYTEPTRNAKAAKPWSDLLDHIFGDKKEERAWFERWAAYPLQHPGTKLNSACLVWGVTEGSGKTMLGRCIKVMYGEHGTEVKDTDLEDTRFEWAQHKAFVLADDITGQDNRKLHNKLKTMVTQETMRINPKFIPSYSVPDVMNYYFTSNDPDALFLSAGDRRYFVHEVLGGKLPIELRKAVLSMINSEEGRNALAYHLLNVDLGDFEPGADALQTEAKDEMKLHVKSEVAAWVHYFKQNTDVILDTAKMTGDLYTTSEIHMLFDPSGEKRAGSTALGKELKKMGFVAPSSAVVKVANGHVVRLVCVRNFAKWAKATPKQISEHYDSTHPAAKGRKY